jgi:hypothetical protein
MDIDPEQQWGRCEVPETLAGRRAGTSATDKARELRREAPIGAVVSRLLRRHTDERAWSKGAFGEKVAGFWLSRLPAGWYVFHDVPVGEHGANIDQVTIGPGGVFTINTKYLSGKVVVTSRSIRVNGHVERYLPVATHEARRASRLLSSAAGREVPVWPILAFAVDDLVVRQPPEDVTVLRVAALPRWLRARPATLTSAEVTQIASVAHKPSTWVKHGEVPSGPSEGGACECGGTLVVRTRRSDGHRFLGCSAYPRCRRTHAVSA